jgi:hypothetical protein
MVWGRNTGQIRGSYRKDLRKVDLMWRGGVPGVEER